MLWEDSQVCLRLRRTLPLAQTRFQSPRPTHPVGRGRARGPARVPSCALGVTHRGRSGALDLGERWARLGRPRLSHFEMRASPAPQVSCLTRRVVTSWLLKARARRKRRGGRGAVICRCVTAYWAEVSAGKTPTHTHTHLTAGICNTAGFLLSPGACEPE